MKLISEDKMHLYIYCITLLYVEVTHSYILPIWQQPLETSSYVAIRKSVEKSHNPQTVYRKLFTSIKEDWMCCVKRYVAECSERRKTHNTVKLCGYYQIGNDEESQLRQHIDIQVHGKYSLHLFFWEFYIERSTIDCGYGSMTVTFGNESESFCGRRIPWKLTTNLSVASLDFESIPRPDNVNYILMAYYAMDPNRYHDTHF